MGFFSGLTDLIGAGVGLYSANKDRKNAQRAAKALEAELDFLEENRQEIINPYDSFENLSDMAVDLSGLKTNISGMATDLSGMATDLSNLITDTSGAISNPMANLAVSTAAAEMKAEQTDIALANTLDTLAATGASAGGATALAQAALQSKKGVTASIEEQEKNNAEKAARGEERVQNAKQAEAKRLQNAQFSEAGRLQNIQMSEAGRLQNIQMSEARRMQDVQFSEAQRIQGIQMQEARNMQNMEAQGDMFVYSETEKRQMQEMDRVAMELSGQRALYAEAGERKSDVISSGVGSIGGILGF